MGYAFQSPRNRVKCSDSTKYFYSTRVNKFQSPRNRVKCSDTVISDLNDEAALCFNPLEIGSSVLIFLAVP